MSGHTCAATDDNANAAVNARSSSTSGRAIFLPWRAGAALKKARGE